ncbi:MAG TPA: peptidylprolyl isomerase [Alphaproteobacteria bacterium]|nr:peptidylprolyl isomerase [Alphaproteobacteria bacterium]
MNKTFLGLAFAIIVAAGAGYAVFAKMGSDTTAQPVAQQPEVVAATDAPATIETSAATEEAEIAATEPAAAPASQKVDNSDNPVVAIVNGSEVHRTDVLEFMGSLPPQMQKLPPESIFPMVLEQVVNAKIVDEKASAANIEQDPQVAKQMAMARTQIIRAVYAEKEIEANYKESDTKKAYDKMVADLPKVEEVKAAHILVDEDAKAKEVIQKLQDGAKFADLAKEYSKDKSNAGNGGDLGYFAQADMVKEFADAAFALGKGEYTKSPVKTQFGYHIILQEDKRVRPAPAYDDVKDELAGKVKRDLLNKMIEEWRETAKVERFDFNGNPVADAPKTATE